MGLIELLKDKPGQIWLLLIGLGGWLYINSANLPWYQRLADFTDDASWPPVPTEAVAVAEMF